ncbi:hypothetical protein E3N88_34543 [Mikania micrantha]|uniref:CCHC-type domain-containing protein n=1 Tax=Mikania micrantha TaxID=192012 RepID=A0A5N6M127_9ASTR|nr:hypothetical protein E3N88_34543 [Mikania micrantha]
MPCRSGQQPNRRTRRKRHEMRTGSVVLRYYCQRRSGGSVMVEDVRFNLDLRSLGHVVDEGEMVRRVLDAMPKSFLQIVASIEQCFELDVMLFDEAVGRLKAYEERLKSHGEKEEEKGQLLLASEHKYGESSGRGRGRGKNYERGGRGRGKGMGRGDKSGMRCFDCGVFGHLSYECTKWNDKDNEVNLIQEDEPTLL